MYCRKPNGVLVDFNSTAYKRCATGVVDGAGARKSKCGGWRYFLADCKRTNTLCSALSGGWVAAVTVCREQLF